MNNNDIDYISFASDLIYSIASELEETMQKTMDRNDYFENTEGLNQAGLKLMFVNQVLHSGDKKPIHIKTSHKFDHRTDAVFVYHHPSRLSPYLLLVIEFDYIPLESINEEARQSKSTLKKHAYIEQEKDKLSLLSNEDLGRIHVRQPTDSNPHRDDEGEKAASLSDRVSDSPTQTINDVLLMNKKLLLEDAAFAIRKNGFTFFSEIEQKEITLVQHFAQLFVALEIA